MTERVGFMRLGLQALHAVVDAFRNPHTGVGGANSKTACVTYEPDDLLSTDELDTLWESNDLAATIVGQIVEDAVRGGFTMKPEQKELGQADADVKKVEQEWKRLDAGRLLKEAAEFARLKGGAGLILDVKGGGQLDTPLLEENITKLDRLIPWTREEMSINTHYPDGRIETYRWSPISEFGGGVPQNVVIHESRLVIFPGALTHKRGRARNHGWDHSVLQRVINTLKSFDGMFGSTDAMFQDASQAVFKLRNLLGALAEDGSDASGVSVQTRLALMDLYRSSQRAVMLDAGDEQGNGEESFEYVDRTGFGNLDGVMNIYLIRLAASARMPLTVLLGMSPAGMDATGESDMTLWFNRVDLYRGDTLTPRWERVMRLVAKNADVDATAWCVQWPELFRMDPLKQATRDNMGITAACQLVVNQIATHEEVALSLEAIAPTLHLKLDKPSREAALKAALEEIKSGEFNEVPEPEADPGNAEKKTERKTPSKTAKRQI